VADGKGGASTGREVVFAKACELALEGIVSKRHDSLYWSGSRNWLKVKSPNFVKT
jgi:ATP-dependent DNA ligase